jgi:hypothetical protein
MELVEQLKMSDQPEAVRRKIGMVNNVLENVVGMAEHETHFEQFKQQGKRLSKLAQTRTFTLECINGHRLQYQLNCD